MKGEQIIPVVKKNQKAKNNLSRASQTKLTSEEQFWKEVRTKSKELIADLLKKVLPIDTSPRSLDLEKDADYRVLLTDDLPRSYEDNEEYQEKITRQTWTQDDVDYVSQEATAWYFDLVAKALADWLSEYPGFESISLASLRGEE